MINFIAAAFNTLPFAGSAAITESAFNALATTAYTYAQAQLLCPIGQAVQSAYRTQGRAANRQTRLTRLALGKATPQAVATQTQVRAAAPVSREAQLTQTTAQPLRASLMTAYRLATHSGVSVQLALRPADRMIVSARVVYRHADRLIVSARLWLGRTNAARSSARLATRPAPRLLRNTDLWHRIAYRPPAGLRRPPKVTPQPHWGDGDTAIIRILPIREHYAVENSCSVIRLDDESPIECTSLSIQSDMQSFSRRFSGNVIYRDLAKIRTNDGPVDIQIIANGIVWKAVITQYQDNRQFGQDSATFTAVSQAISLAKPYALLHTGINAAAANAQQLALELLLYTGWGLDWHTTVDWLIPAGVFSLVNAAPIDGIKQLANAVGAFVQADLADKTLHVRPAYPVAPWAVSTATPDVFIPVDAATVVAGEWIQNPQINGVWVSGQQAGVCALVRRTGTAGDVLAPMVLDPLLTVADANAAKGLAILAESGARQPVSLTLGIYPEIGLIEPGQIVHVGDVAYSWKGICQGVSVSIAWREDGLDITQTPVIEHWYG